MNSKVEHTLNFYLFEFKKVFFVDFWLELNFIQ